MSNFVAGKVFRASYSWAIGFIASLVQQLSQRSRPGSPKGGSRTV
jgi:hypothetical protein